MYKDTFYFSHDYNARNDNKIKKLLAKHGYLGYGIFWAIIEDLYNNANALPLDYEGIAYDLRIDKYIIESIINDFGLFVIEGENFGSFSVQKRLEDRNSKSQNARNSAFKRWKNSDRNATAMRPHSDRNANALRMHSECNAIKERKEKERKEKERKGKERKELFIENNSFLKFREKIFKESVSEFFKKNFQLFLTQWAMKNKDVPVAEVLESMDKNYVCHTFIDENHIRNAFKSTYEKLKITKTKTDGQTVTVSKAEGYKQSAINLLHKRGINPADYIEPTGNS